MTWRASLLWLACVSAGVAQEEAVAPAAAVAAPTTPLQRQAVAALRAMDQETAIDLAFRVEQLDGTLLVDYRTDEAWALASNTKLFTTAAALLGLGADYRWHSRAYLLTEDDGGTTLCVVGGGDPSLRALPDRDAGAAFLDALAEALVASGHPAVHHLVVDGSRLPVDGPHPLWPQDQLNASYAAPLAALTTGGGLVSITWDGHRIHLEPTWRGALSDKTFQSPISALSAWWSQAHELRIRKPKHSRPMTVQLAQQQPLEIATRWLEQGLSQRGISLGDATATLAAVPGLATAPLLLDWPSAWTLGEVVVACNKDSDNFLAETLLLSLGLELEGVGDWPHGARAVHQVLADTGLTPFTFNQVDGSGLARDWPRRVDQADAATLCALLRMMAERPEGRLWFDSLPIGGVDGSLRKRFQEAIFQPQRVHAKTGFIMGASSLSGYLLDRQNRILVFSFLVNFDRGRNPDSNNRRFIELRHRLLQMVLEASA